MTEEMEDEQWATSFSDAMTRFQVNYWKSNWPKSDLKKINEVVDELKLRDHRFSCNSSQVFDVDEDNMWKRDQGILHIHKTMLVARRPFTGSVDRGPTPYPEYPHFFPLSGFVEKGSPSKVDEFDNTVLCPTRFIRVPAGFECECGEVHLKS